MATTDVHGRATPWDHEDDREAPWGLTRFDCDMLSGVSYVIDLARPPGSRILQVTHRASDYVTDSWRIIPLEARERLTRASDPGR